MATARQPIEQPAPRYCEGFAVRCGDELEPWETLCPSCARQAKLRRHLDALAVEEEETERANSPGYLARYSR